MTEVASKLNETFRAAEAAGSWPDYAVRMLGSTDTGDDTLDSLLAELYSANEAVHRRANQLALKYEVEFFNG